MKEFYILVNADDHAAEIVIEIAVMIAITIHRHAEIVTGTIAATPHGMDPTIVSLSSSCLLSSVF